MAKLKGPLFSVSAHGAINKTLLYSRKKGNNIIRKFHYPKKPTSLKQWTQRHIIGLLTAHWQVKTTSEKKVYNDLAAASGLNIPGFNYFLKVAQQNLKSHHGLCGYWPMNEKSGNQALDYSGCGNHGTLLPSYPSNCPTRVDAMIKQYGNALLFDGIDEYLNCGNKPSLNITDAITIEAWVKTATLSLPNGHRMFFTMLGNSYFSISTDGSPKPFLSLSIGGLQKALNSNYVMSIDTWYHIVGTYNGSVMKVFVNGVEKNHLDVSGALDTGAATDKFIGKYTSSSYNWNGTIDEVRIYNRDLGLEEMLKHYNLLRLDKQRQPLIIH